MAGEQWDAPNQQVVRADESPPWEEGSGGSAGDTAETGMTKAELLAYAQEIGATPANTGMTKDELQASIDAKLAEEPVEA